MDSQLGIALSVIVVSIVMFIASLVFKDKAGDKPARFAFRLFYFFATLFFIVISVNIRHPSVILNLLGDLSLAILNASLVIGILWRCKSKISSSIIILIAVSYFIADVFIPVNSIQIAYFYNAICSLICVYALLNREGGRNVGDQGMAAIFMVNAVFLLVNNASFLGILDTSYYSQFTVIIFIFAPAYLAGLSLFLFSSYMLDAHKALEIQATTDSLTGLYNRRFFLKEANRVLQTSARHQDSICMMMCDIDHFKEINDNYGHKAGDLALVAFANVLKDSLRGGDILARYGGEEFVVLLPQTDISQACNVAERMRHQTEQLSITIEKGVIAFTASFGVCQVQNYQEIEVSIHQADKAMYRAKTEGRNLVKESDAITV